MRYGTLGIGAALTVLAGVLMGLTALEPALAVGDMISPKRITYVFLSLLGLFGLLLIRRGLREIRAARADGETSRTRRADKRLFAFMALCAAYAAALSLLGHFLPCTFVLLLAGLLLLRVGRVRAALIALVFSLTVFSVFKTLLGVPLP